MTIQWADLEMLHVENDSEADEEYVLIRVVKAGHTARYAVVDTTYDSKGRISNHFRHIFLLPRMIVSEGDYIQIYTGVGDATSFENKADTITRVLYWGSKDPVWNDKEGDEARLIKFGVVNRVTVPPKKNPPSRTMRIKPKQ